MATCLLCNKDVTTGYVLCGECAEGVKSSTEPELLEHFIMWLGTEIANDFTVKPCSMCGRAHCDDISQCRGGVTAWLRAKMEQYCQAALAKRPHEKPSTSILLPGSIPDSNRGGTVY